MSVDEKTLKAYLHNAAEHFRDPQEVLNHSGLSRDDKRRILESWKVDEQELITATGENMGGEESYGEEHNMLSRVAGALQALENNS